MQQSGLRGDKKGRASETGQPVHVCVCVCRWVVTEGESESERQSSSPPSATATNQTGQLQSRLTPIAGTRKSAETISFVCC